MSYPFANEDQDLPISCQPYRRIIMPDIRGRKEGNPIRTRPRSLKTDSPQEFGQNILEEETPPRP